MASLVCSCLICLPGINLLLGVGLGVAALVVVSKSNGELRGREMAINGIVISLATTFFVGIVAAITVPGFIQFQRRAKMTEAKSNLRGLATAEEAFYTDHQRFVPLGPIPSQPVVDNPIRVPKEAVPAELGWWPEDPVRFQYRATVSGEGAERKVHLTADATFEYTDGHPAHAEIDVFPDHIGDLSSGDESFH